MTDISQGAPMAVEGWWHRLFRVLILGATIAVLGYSLAIFCQSAKHHSYSYNFEPNFQSSKGEDARCEAQASLNLLSCGEYSDGAELLARYLKSKGADKVPGSTETVAEYFESQLRQGHGDTELAANLIRDRQLISRRQTNWDTTKLVVATAKAFAMAAACLIILSAIYKAVLFTSHGHTRLRKEYE